MNSPLRNILATVSHHWLPLTVSLLVLVTALSLWPLPHLPEVPGSDKTHHLIAYAALAFPVALRSPNRWLFIVMAIMLYGGMIELVQPFVNRYGEWMDFFAVKLDVSIFSLCGRLMESNGCSRVAIQVEVETLEN